METPFSDDEQKWFDQCSGALLCKGKAMPLVLQPWPDTVKPDGLIGGVRNYLVKKYRDWIMG
jgi:hypothetical protein